MTSCWQPAWLYSLVEQRGDWAILKLLGIDPNLSEYPPARPLNPKLCGRATRADELIRHQEPCLPFIVRDKLWLGQVLHTSDKVFHIIVGLALYWLFCWLLKKPWKALIAVLVVELVNELNDIIVAYPHLTRLFWSDTATDILATMIVPCLITAWLAFRQRGKLLPRLCFGVE